MLEVSAKNWEEEVLRAKELVIVDFWHEQCVFCLQLNPVYEELSKEKEYKGKVKFTKLDIRESHENFHIALKYGIMATPTLKFFCQGRVAGELIGYMPREVLKKEIDNILEKSEECLKNSTEIKDVDL